ncbi:MAG: hypothetical protein D6820_16225, partial [Lentisphaerae bacterium]
YWRIPSHIGKHPEGLKGTLETLKYGFYPGRSILKLDTLTRWGIGGRTLREDPRHRGKPDYSIFKGLSRDEERWNLYLKLFGRDFQYASCFDNWPAFMALQNTRLPNTRGTPADYAEAAKLAAYVIQAQKEIQGHTAHWWEVKNESTISSEWVLHGEPGVDSWLELAKFHNTMADVIHRYHPEIKVGGPTSAWMALHFRDFELARKQLRFMDRTKDHLDFYSHHFYEGKKLILSSGERYWQGYLLGRLEGCLDLLRNHMVLTNNVKPFIISETGTLCDFTSELNLWINSKNLSSYLIRYLERPDVRLISLWFIPVPWWNKESPILFEYTADNQLRLRPKATWWMKLWKDFRGVRIGAEPGDNGLRHVHLHAARDGKVIYLAVNNLNPFRLALNLDFGIDPALIRSISQTRFYFDRGKMHFEILSHRPGDKLPVAVEETTMIRIELKDELPFTGAVNEVTVYGDRTLIPTGRPEDVHIMVPRGDLEYAYLRICASREGGFTAPLRVLVNGKVLAEKAVLTLQPGKKDNWWSWVKIPVPPTLLRDGKSNTIRAEIKEEGGYITTVALVGAYRKSPDWALEQSQTGMHK